MQPDKLPNCPVTHWLGIGQPVASFQLLSYAATLSYLLSFNIAK